MFQFVLRVILLTLQMETAVGNVLPVPIRTVQTYLTVQIVQLEQLHLDLELQQMQPAVRKILLNISTIRICP